MLSLRFQKLLPELEFCVTEICSALNYTVCDNAEYSVTLSPSESISLSLEGNSINITYNKKHQLARALSLIPSLLKDGETINESAASGLLCYMADMSRNAVFNIPTAKQMIRYLAIMGYNSLMLYTEDTYEIPEYQYFGHMRGRFSKDELREIDDYAYALGIEVIPCIQTLAHLGTALRWPDFAGYTDIDDILLVGDERTYKFIDRAISVCKECFRSRRINIGMDEAHNIGRGKYLSQNGYRKSSDIMCEHLERVVGICEEHGFYPMMWSDMFFRMAFNGVYRVREGEISEDVIAKVPKGLTLIYWDYYSRDKQIVEHMLDCHKKFDNPIAFAGGAWKWSGFGAHNRYSLISTELQMDVCADKGIDDVIVTAWGDCGAEASQFSALASMIYFAERKYRADSGVTEQLLDERARACFSLSFDELLCFDLPDLIPYSTPDCCDNPKNPSKYLFYNDPLEALLDMHVDPKTAPDAFRKNSETLLALSDHSLFGYAFETLGLLCRVLASKCDYSIRLREAYRSGDKVAMHELSEEALSLCDKIDDFMNAFRRQWYRENKTFGFSAQEQRAGGLIMRLRSTAMRIESYLAGEVEAIEELEQPVLPFPSKHPADSRSPYIQNFRWDNVTAAGLL